MKATLVLLRKTKDANEVLPTLQENQKPEHICKNMSEVLQLLNEGDL